jgi:hypothetical protein
MFSDVYSMFCYRIQIVISAGIWNSEARCIADINPLPANVENIVSSD